MNKRKIMSKLIKLKTKAKNVDIKSLWYKTILPSVKECVDLNYFIINGEFSAHVWSTWINQLTEYWKLRESLKDTDINYLHQLIVDYFNNTQFTHIDIRDETFYWGDFCSKWDGMYLKNIEDMVKDLTRVYAYVISINGKSIQKVNIHESLKLFKNIPGHIEFKYYQYIDKNQYKLCGIKDILMSEYGKKIKYGSIIFEPYSPLSTLSDVNNFNLFRGFKATVKHNINYDNIQPILHHIKTVFSGDNEEWYKWILSWLSHLIKTPQIKTEKVLTLASKIHGIGKGIFFKWLIQYVMGDLHAVMINGLDKVTQRLNSIIEGKILVVIDEVDNADKYGSAYNKLKSLITEYYQTVEKKGVDAVVIKDCCNYVILSNNEHCVYIEQHDRRYAMPDISPIYTKNTEYFNKLGLHLTKETADDFLSYLLIYESIDIRDINLLPLSETKQSMSELSLSSSQLFVKEFNNGSMNLCEMVDNNSIFYDKHGHTYIKKDGLFEVFKLWCHKHGKHTISSQRFFKDIKGTIDEAYPYLNDGSRHRGFKLYLSRFKSPENQDVFKILEENKGNILTDELINMIKLNFNTICSL